MVGRICVHSVDEEVLFVSHYVVYYYVLSLNGNIAFLNAVLFGFEK